MAHRVFLDSLGCRLNQAEIERIAAELTAAGHTLVPSPEACDWAVVNTCTVTHRADADSRARLRRVHRLNPLARIIATGCWSTVEAAAAAELAGVVHVVPNGDKASIAALLGEPDSPPGPRAAIPGPRRRARAFLAVQDGCDRACAYCLTTLARGPSRSASAARVVADAQRAETGGAGELVLCGVQLSGWGRDLPGRPHIGDLLDALLDATASPRIRLSSVEPWGLPPDLFERWDNPRLCRQLHLPLQSGCDATLARMGRPYRRDQAAALIASARRRIPQLAVTTDVLVGFPGETEDDHRASLDWLVAVAPADVHVFPYSPRPGTRAARLPEPVPTELARARRREVLDALAPARGAFRQGLSGTGQEVLWVHGASQPGGRWELSGITDHGVPVRAASAAERWGLRDVVQLADVEPWGIRASICAPV